MPKKKCIYMDSNSTTQVDPVVGNKVGDCIKKYYANPSSSHHPGKTCRKIIDQSRDTIADLLNVKPCEIYFTSGATESNNLALRGLYLQNKKRGNHIITSKIEHASIMKTCEDLEKHFGCRVSYAPVDRYGMIHPKTIVKMLTPKTTLVSIMLGNNEIGTIQPIKKISKIIKQYNPKIHFHCDATQMVGKYIIHPKHLGIDSMSASGHKFHAIKGCGFLYLRDGCPIKACETGGHQEHQIRSGTENIHGIMSLGMAMDRNLKDYGKVQKTHQKIQRIRDFMEQELRKQIPNIVVNGHPKKRMVNTLSICLPNINSRNLLTELDKYGICLNVGSACNQGARSWVLKSIGLPVSLEQGALRISLSKYNTLKEAKYVVDTIAKLYNKHVAK